MKEDYSHLKFVYYGRRSIKANKTELDTRIASLDSQKFEIDQLADRYNITILKTFSETESASEADERPEFEKMVAYIKSGKANAILCFAIDRLSRNPMDSAKIETMLQKGNLQMVLAPDRKWTLDGHVIARVVEAAAANQYIIDLKKHIKRGQGDAVRRGFRPGLAPIGYINSRYREKGMDEEIKVDEHPFRILRSMFDRVLSGQYTPFQVLKWATEVEGFRSRKTRRYPKGRPLSKAAWYNILSSRFYYGEFEYPTGAGNWTQITGMYYKPLITRAEFETVQHILRKDAPRPKKHEHAYVGLMRCGHCGARITCEAKTKRQKNGNVHHYSYYRCTGQVDPDCTEKCTRQDRLEEQVVNYLSSIQISPAFHQWAISELKKEYDREMDNKTSVLYLQHREHQKVKEMLTRLYDMRLVGDIDSDYFQKEKGRLETEEKRLDGQLAVINARVQTWIYDAERIMTFAERAASEFKKGSMEKRRSILAALGTEHKLMNRELTIKTQKPLRVVHEMVSESKEAGFPLEPPKEPLEYGSNGKKKPVSLRLWRWGESNPRAGEMQPNVYNA